MGQYLLSLLSSKSVVQLLFLGLIPMKSQASTNSVLRPCPRSEKSKMRTVQSQGGFKKKRRAWVAGFLWRTIEALRR